MARRDLRGTWGLVVAALTAMAVSLSGLTIVAATVPVNFDAGIGWPEALLILFTGTGVVALWVAWPALKGHFEGLERLRGVLAMAAAGQRPPPAGDDEDLAPLYAALADLHARRQTEAGRSDDRLAAVLASVQEPVAVVTADGQVSLVNAPAKRLLGAERVALGTSVFRALVRDGVVALLEEAERRAGPAPGTVRGVEGIDYPVTVVPLEDGSGAVLTFQRRTADDLGETGVEHDLRLHDVPPPSPDVTGALPLGEVPALVLDTETTGLDVTADRIVSVGAVRLHGARLYPAASLDLLVNPGVPIPARSAAVHGITDAMVAGAPPFAAVHGEVAAMVRGTVAVGHNIGFDLALLRRESALAGLDWTDPPWLDTLLLAGALFPEMTDLNLETLAERLGVDVHGRHTALGDALVTAEVYIRMVPLLAEAGAATLGAAQALMETPKHLRAQQKQAGW